MPKYKVGDKFAFSFSECIAIEVLYVPPKDQYGIQYYVCSVYWIEDPANKSISMYKESNLDSCDKLIHSV